MSATAQPGGHPPGDTTGPEFAERDVPFPVAGATATVGVGVIAWPRVDDMNPSNDLLAPSATQAASPFPVASAITPAWRGKPVFARHRTAQENGAAQDGPRGARSGWICPRDGSQNVTPGRERPGPASAHLPPPPNTFASDTRITVG